MIIVTDGHASHDCAKFAELYTLKGFLSLVDSLVFRGIVSILRGLFNKSKPSIACLETYPFYSMINLSSSTVKNI